MENRTKKKKEDRANHCKNKKEKEERKFGLDENS